MKTTFSIRHTNIVKGCAIILLLFHHLFYKLESFEGCFTFCQSELMVYNIVARLSKVCVAIFLILSGYGLTISANKSQESVTYKFAFRHITKLMINFWVIYFLFVPLGFAFGRNPIGIYGTGVFGVGKFLLDFFGISYLANTPTFNATWWFMGEILRLYILFPLLYCGVKNNKLLLLGLGCALCFFYNLLWFLPFICGMIIAEKDLFSWYMNLKWIKKGLIVFGLLAFIPARIMYGLKFDTMFALEIITFVLLFIKPENVFGKMLEILGKHSGNLFMFHTFIYAYYFKKFIYSFQHPIIILLVLLLICFGISCLIEKMKQVLHFEKVYSIFCKRKSSEI